MAVGQLAIIGASLIAEPLSRGFGPTPAFQQRQHQRDLLQRSKNLLGSDRIGQRFDELLDLSDPFINELLTEASAVGGAQSRAAAANLARLGLGQRGETFGAALSRGANFQAGSLKARLMQAILGEAVGIQTTLSNQAAGVAGVPAQFQPSQTAQFLGAGLQAADAFTRSRETPGENVPGPGTATTTTLPGPVM